MAVSPARPSFPAAGDDASRSEWVKIRVPEGRGRDNEKDRGRPQLSILEPVGTEALRFHSPEENAERQIPVNSPFGLAFDGRPPGTKTAAKKARPRRKGPPKADSYFKKLPRKFTIDDVRKVAERASGISIAQWVRSRRVKETGDGYQKVA